MEGINEKIKQIIADNKDCDYKGYFLDDDTLYVYMYEKNGSTGDSIVILKEDLRTGNKDKTIGIGGVLEWGLSLKEFTR